MRHCEYFQTFQQIAEFEVSLIKKYCCCAFWKRFVWFATHNSELTFYILIGTLKTINYWDMHLVRIDDEWELYSVPWIFVIFGRGYSSVPQGEGRALSELRKCICFPKKAWSVTATKNVVGQSPYVTSYSNTETSTSTKTEPSEKLLFLMKYRFSICSCRWKNCAHLTAGRTLRWYDRKGYFKQEPYHANLYYKDIQAIPRTRWQSSRYNSISMWRQSQRYARRI